MRYSPDAGPGGDAELWCRHIGDVTGTITAANIIGPTAQGITPGNFDGLVDALNSNAAYGNIHSTTFPAGEIRGEIRPGEGDQD